MRKHHNKLFFGVYTHKAKFKIPESNVLYPTNDLHCLKLAKVWDKEPVADLAEFIMSNRHNMKFRIQHPYTIIYGEKEIIAEAIDTFWEHWVGVTTADPKKIKHMNNQTVVCKRLPLGKYQYQVHVHRKMQSRITREQRDMLHQYLTQNQENATVTNRSLISWLSGSGDIGYGYNGYFYVKDKKALLPIYMISHYIVEKITKFVKV